MEGMTQEDWHGNVYNGSMQRGADEEEMVACAHISFTHSLMEL